MAEEKEAVTAEETAKAAEESAQAKTKTQSKGKDAPRAKEYSLEHLSQYCLRLFGITSSTFAGATASLDPSKTYTLEYVKEHIEKWKKKGVK